ncbi:MAG: type II toxin-antitoxin system YoeB family toxin [Aliarcobacter sp.]|nr:type II toxin-antitoxin system YoeB family toxin [Aliarcobacter sp.]MDD4330679.1 type II toxin-antitoxin system YoeB family toxin [Aliarcobacter sp.]
MYRQNTDKQILKKINQLIKERISDEHRLVYEVSESYIAIVSCRFHY